MDLITKVGRYLEIPKSRLGKSTRVDSLMMCIGAALKDTISRSRSCRSHILIEAGLTPIINTCKILEKKGLIDLSVVEMSAEGNITAHEVSKYLTRTSRLLICSHNNPISLVANNLKGIANIPILLLLDYRVKCKSLPHVEHIVINIPDIRFVLYIGKFNLEASSKPEPDMRQLDTIMAKLVIAEKYKNAFMNKLSGIVGCMSIQNFNSVYDQSICRLTCVIIGNILGSISISFVSAYNKRRIRLSFASAHNITSPRVNSAVKLGFSLIDFTQCDSQQRLAEWIRQTSDELAQQYPRILDEVRINKLSNRKKHDLQPDRRVRFSSTLCFTPVRKAKSTYPKSVLKKKSKYR